MPASDSRLARSLSADPLPAAPALPDYNYDAKEVDDEQFSLVHRDCRTRWPVLQARRRTRAIAAVTGAAALFLVLGVLLRFAMWKPEVCPFPAYEVIRLPQANLSDGTTAACMDGSAVAYYLRRGRGVDAQKLVIDLQGGGWCGSYEECSVWGQRSSNDLPVGCSRIADGYGGGFGMLYSEPSMTAWHSWSVASVHYCDGASFTGTRAEPAMGPSGPQYRRGHFNFMGVFMDVMQRVQPSELILTGCSAGGLAAILKCDFVADLLASGSRPIPFRCMADAGVFPGSGFDAIVNAAHSNPALPNACVAGEGAQWRGCFGEAALRYLRTPIFLINSIYNWRFGQDPVAYREASIAALAPVLNHSSPHGLFADSCDAHCESTDGWSTRLVNGSLMKDAAAHWYFDGSVETHLDSYALNENPTC